MNNQKFSVLANKSFLFLWLAEVFSQVAMNMSNFILVFVTYELSKLTTASSAIVLAFLIPSIIFGIPAGVFVDKWNKKKVLFVTSLIRAIILFVLVFTYNNLFVVLALAFAISLVTQFFIPAEVPMIPLLVKKEHLLTANALFSMGFFGSILLAYAFSGPFIIVFGKTTVFAVLGLIFLCASFFITFIRVPVLSRVKLKIQETGIVERLPYAKHPSLIKEALEAVTLIAKSRALFNSLFLLVLSQILILVMVVIGGKYATDILDIDVKRFPLLFVTPAAIGLIMGAGIVSRFFAKYSRQRVTASGVLLSGMIVFLLSFGSAIANRGFVKWLNMYLPPLLQIDLVHTVISLAFLLGFANALVLVAANTSIQEHTSDHIRGKVYGALNAFTGIFSVLPILVIGIVADTVGLPIVLQVIGGFIFCIGLFYFMVT